MKVSEVMTSAVGTVAPDTSYKEVVERLVRAGVSSLPVVDSDGRLIGLITEADLISKEAYGRHNRALALLADVLAARDRHWATKAAGAVAADVMTEKVVVCGPGDDVRSVARRMLARGVKRMPVVAAGSLVGMVSRHDILKMFDRPDDAIAADVQHALSDGRNMPEETQVRFSVDEGVVTLTGDVRYEWDEAIVVSIVRGVAGVLEVVSHLRHREPNPRRSTQPWMFGAR